MVAQELLDLVEQVDGLLEIDRPAGVVVHLVDDLLELLDVDHQIVVVGDQIDATINHVFAFWPDWSAEATQAGLAITDFDPPVINSAELQAGTVTASVSGTLGQGPSAATAPLDLQLSYEVQRSMRSVLQQAGLDVDRQGKGQVRVRGTPSAPDVR